MLEGLPSFKVLEPASDSNISLTHQNHLQTPAASSSNQHLLIPHLSLSRSALIKITHKLQRPQAPTSISSSLRHLSHAQVYAWGRGEHGILGFGDNKSSQMVPQKAQLFSWGRYHSSIIFS